MKYIVAMKSFVVFLICLSSLIFFSACSERQLSSNPRYLIPWPDANGDYSFQKIEVPSLSDKESVSGAAAKLFVHPQIINGQLGGAKPNARFAKSGSLYIPKDTVSQELIAVYAHMERLMKIDKAIGIKDLLSWPRRVGVQTLSVDEKGERLGENASYSLAYDAVMFFPFDLIDRHPLSLNAGVIAHEHFHAIFTHLVQYPLMEVYGAFVGFPIATTGFLKPGKLEEILIQKQNFFLLRAFNEGLADLWAIAYTDDKKFLLKSIHKDHRDYDTQRLNGQIAQSELDIKNPLTSFKEITGDAYLLGSKMAALVIEDMEHVLEKKLSSADLKKAQVLKANYLLDLTKKIADIFMTKYKEGISSEDMALAIYSDRELNASDCTRLKEALSKGHILLDTCKLENPRLDLQNYLEEFGS